VSPATIGAGHVAGVVAAVALGAVSATPPSNNAGATAADNLRGKLST
jgi:hypothetical protein